MEKSVSSLRLLYIGQADDIRTRIQNHNKWPAWKKELHTGEQVCVSVAGVNHSVRDRVEAAMIFKHKPPCNIDCVDSFPFASTTITVLGRCRNLNRSFTVSQSQKFPGAKIVLIRRT
jgi:hypothetical protein